MKIEVVATAQQLSEGFTKDKTVVVIDVLRATSVITTALFHGAAAVWPVLSVEEANALFQRFPAGTALRGGERGGMKIDGFEQGNSPLSYTAGTVSNKHLILTTTNGTVIAVATVHDRMSTGFAISGGEIMKHREQLFETLTKHEP